MRSLTAKANGNICPKCGDNVRHVNGPILNGFARHATNPDCDFERGEKDETTKSVQR